MDSTREPAAEFARLADRLWFGPAGALVRDALASAAGILTPVWCIGCHEQDVVLCDLCAEHLHLMTRSAFPAEAQALALPLLMTPESITVLPVSAAGRYEGLLARAVLAFKDHGAVGLVAALGPGLGRALLLAVTRVAGERAGGATGSRPWLLVGPPPSLRSQLTRGFDPVQVLLDRALAGAAFELPRAGLGLQRVPGLVRPTRGAALRSLNPRAGRQKTRGARARRRGSVGSIELTARGRRLLPGADVVLVDDVVTSGSTLAELHRVLRCAGARVHGAAVLAAAPGPGSELGFPLVRASPEA